MPEDVAGMTLPKPLAPQSGARTSARASVRRSAHTGVHTGAARGRHAASARTMVGAALFAWAIAMPARAHDSWFEPAPPLNGRPTLWLGTGNQFPVLESPIAFEYLVSQGCTAAGAGRRAAAVAPAPMQPLGLTERALRLRLPFATPASCWAQLQPFDVALEPDSVALYLDEIRAAPAVRQAWSAMQAGGTGWTERYVKHVRIAFGGVPHADAAGTTMPFDLRFDRRPGPIVAGETLAVQLLRDGRPWPGQALELRSESSPIGVWRETDAEGRVVVQVPLAGRWLLRGVELHRPDAERRPGHWLSRFVMLAFEVAPRPPKRGSGR